MSTDASSQTSVAQLYGVIAQVLGVSPALINDQSSPNTIPTWDSLRSIMLVTALEDTYRLSFTLAEIMAVKNVTDIKTTLNAHGISFTHDDTAAAQD